MNDLRQRAIQVKCNEVAERGGAPKIDAALARATEVARLRGLTPASALTPRLRELEAVATAAMALKLNLAGVSEALDRALILVGAIEDASNRILELTGSPDVASLWDCPGLRDLSPHRTAERAVSAARFGVPGSLCHACYSTIYNREYRERNRKATGALQAVA
jgi:hypothetical protein